MSSGCKISREMREGCGNIPKSILGIRSGLVLFILIYIIYNINMRTINSGDTWPASMLPFAILGQRTLYLDMFSNFFQSLDFTPHMVVVSEGHYLSIYPIVIPVLLTPLYVIPHLLLNLLQFPLDMLNTSFYLLVFIIEKLFASLIAATSVVFCFLAWKELIRREMAFLCAGIYAFATNTWATSSQALWQQGMVELILSILIFLTIINEKKRSDRKIIFMGILSGLFIFNRPSDSLLMLPVLVYAFHLGKRHFLYYMVSGALSGFPFLAYNLFFFHNVFGGYGDQLSEFTLGSSFLVNMSGLLFSPSRGLLIYSPILLLSLLGYMRIRDIDARSLRLFFYVAGFSILLELIVYSSFREWWGGSCYGPRFLVCLLPFLVTYIGLYLNGWLHLGCIKGKDILYLCLIAVILIWSIFVQVVGVFFYPNGNWDGSPQAVDLSPNRLWDWNDNPINRCLHSGPIIVNPFKIFGFLSGHDSHQVIDETNKSIGWSRLNDEGIIGGLKGYDST
jgi:hypothetical protein